MWTTNCSPSGDNYCQSQLLNVSWIHCNFLYFTATTLSSCKKHPGSDYWITLLSWFLSPVSSPSNLLLDTDLYIFFLCTNLVMLFSWWKFLMLITAFKISFILFRLIAFSDLAFTYFLSCCFSLAHSLWMPWTSPGILWSLWLLMLLHVVPFFAPTI